MTNSRVTGAARDACGVVSVDRAAAPMLGCCFAKRCSLNFNHELRVPRESGRIGKRVRFPRGPATVMLSKLPATEPLIFRLGRLPRQRPAPDQTHFLRD